MDPSQTKLGLEGEPFATAYEYLEDVKRSLEADAKEGGAKAA